MFLRTYIAKRGQHYSHDEHVRSISFEFLPFFFPENTLLFFLVVNKQKPFYFFFASPPKNSPNISKKKKKFFFRIINCHSSQSKKNTRVIKSSFLLPFTASCGIKVYNLMSTNYFLCPLLYAQTRLKKKSGGFYLKKEKKKNVKLFQFFGGDESIYCALHFFPNKK